MENTTYLQIDALVQNVISGVAEYDNLVADQCALLMQAAELLVSRLAINDRTANPEFLGTLHKGERAATMSRNLDLLSRCPPLERHEWVRAVIALDTLIGRIDDAINEATLMCVEPDQALREMSLLAQSAGESLQQGFAELNKSPFKVQQAVSVLTGLVEAMEMRSMRAMTILFSLEKWNQEVTPTTVLHMIKKWMVYRCLIDVKQQLATASDSLLALSAIREGHRHKRLTVMTNKPDHLASNDTR